jgi:hypothetical protein
LTDKIVKVRGNKMPFRSSIRDSINDISETTERSDSSAMPRDTIMALKAEASFPISSPVSTGTCPTRLPFRAPSRSWSMYRAGGSPFYSNIDYDDSRKDEISMTTALRAIMMFISL